MKVVCTYNPNIEIMLLDGTHSLIFKNQTLQEMVITRVFSQNFTY